MSDHPAEPATETFVAYRNLLFTVAYELLGSAADAEDVLQETWLRWVKVDLNQVHDPRAYLVRITTRQALNRLRTMKRRRETYVGPWLPEPLLTTPDVADDVELAESVSMALLLVLETLSPTERAVFVLREVFNFGYDEIAATVDKSPVAVRQIIRRAPPARRGPSPTPRWSPPARPGRRWRRSSTRWRPVTCRACSTYSPLTWCWWPTVAESSRPRCGRSPAPTGWPACSSGVLLRWRLRSPADPTWSTATRPSLVGSTARSTAYLAVCVEEGAHHRPVLRPQPGEAFPHRV